jgi:hypothetical protein
MSEPENISRRSHLLILILFAVLTLLMTWPVVARLGTHLAGGRDDLFVHQWTFWWVRQALREGLSPFFTPYLYAPEGVSLTSHNIAWFNIALWLPLQALFGRTAAYNLVFLATVTLNGYCMYLFAWQALRSQIAAVIAGLIFGFWPYTLSHYDHSNMMVVFWVPLILLLLHRMLSDVLDSAGGHRRWLLLLAAAGSLAMIGITRWQLLIMSSPILVGYTFYLLWANPSARTWRTLSELFAVGGLALVLMAPLASPMIMDQFTRDFPEDVFLDEPLWGRTDLAAYFVPSINNGLWKARVAPIYEHFVVNKFYTPYLGYTTLALAVVGVIRRWRQAWIWLLLALFYVVLALGPELAINGRAFPSIPMPYRLVDDFFLLRMIRRPDRLNIFLSLPLAMLAGLGMQAIRQNVTGPRARHFLTIAALLLILLAYLPVPFATTRVVTPEWYSLATREEGELAILDIPVNDRYYDKWYMQYQTDHGLPLATGHVSRLPREATAFLDSVPFLADLAERDQLPDPAYADVTQQLKLLSDAGIRYLVIHKDFANDGLQAIWRDWLSVDPAHEDSSLIVYRTDLQHGRDFVFAHDLSGGIGLVKASYDPIETIQGGAVNSHVIWGTADSPEEDYVVCIALLNEIGARSTERCVEPVEGQATGNWAANDLFRASYALPIPSELPAGQYTLVLTLAEPTSGVAVGNQAELGPVTVLPFSPSNSQTAVWQNGIELVGSDLGESDGDLAVTLYWVASQQVPESYKVFLHLEDANSGAIVAQSDTVPRNWTYPTSSWQPGEIVRDLVTIPAGDLPQGSYRVRLGLYDEQTGKRMPLVTDGIRPQDTFSLGEWER